MTSGIPSTFRGFQHTAFGPVADVVQLNEKIPTPALDPAQLRVKIVSAATNPVDWKRIERGNLFLSTPATPENPLSIGYDLAGIVVEVGANAGDSFKIGDEVYAMTQSGSNASFAEYISIDPRLVAAKPKNLSFDEAAGIPLAGQTSHQALLEQGHLKAGQTVLILGGSGGTGSLAVQIAKSVGATVITTTSSRNVDWVKELGADRVIDYTKEKWGEVLEDHSVDLIYDTGVEPASWNTHAQRVLKKDTGRFISILSIPAPIESPIGATGLSFFTRPNAVDLSDLTRLAEEGKLKVRVNSVHKFEKLVEALEVQKAGRAKGKIILQVAPQSA